MKVLLPSKYVFFLADYRKSNLLMVNTREYIKYTARKEAKRCGQPSFINLPYHPVADFGWPVGFAALIAYDIIRAEEPLLEPMRNETENIKGKLLKEKPKTNYLMFVNNLL